MSTGGNGAGGPHSAGYWDWLGYRVRRSRVQADALADAAAGLARALRRAEDAAPLTEDVTASATALERSLLEYRRATEAEDEQTSLVATLPTCAICRRRANPSYGTSLGTSCHWCRHIPALLDAIRAHERQIEAGPQSKTAWRTANRELYDFALELRQSVSTR